MTDIATHHILTGRILTDRFLADRVLTNREQDVLVEIIRGRSNAEIGRELYVAEKTVKTHVTRILRKLDLRDRVAVVIYGYESGIVQPKATPINS